MTPVAIFVRVSSRNQDYQRQISDLTKFAQKQEYEVVETIFVKQSAFRRSLDERQGIEQLLELARTKKIQKVLITEVTRIGRTLLESHKLLVELTRLKISIYIQNLGLETLLSNGKSNPAATILFLVMGEFAERDSELKGELIRSGQAEAIRKGKKIGRKLGSHKTTERLLSDYPRVVSLIKQGFSIRHTAKICDVAAKTVQKVKHAYLQAQVA